jgi:pimeloyl-ACP methyl ester carboxylesterase
MHDSRPTTSPSQATPQETVHANDVDLAVQAFGDPTTPAILLISGAEASMDWWDDDFTARLAASGRYVIRYDTRDTGRSTTFPVGAPTYTQDDLLADAVGVLDRSPVPAAASNHWMIGGGEPIRPRLGEITAPTLVLHGNEDPLFPYGHAEALAREIPGASLVPLPGMGHQMPPYQVWDTVIPAIAGHTEPGVR